MTARQKVPFGLLWLVDIRVMLALISLHKVAQHNTLSALRLLNLIEPLSHFKHLHLDQLQIDTLLLILSAGTLISHLIPLLFELGDALDHISVATRDIFQLDAIIEISQVYLTVLGSGSLFPHQIIHHPLFVVPHTTITKVIN